MPKTVSPAPIARRAALARPVALVVLAALLSIAPTLVTAAPEKSAPGPATLTDADAKTYRRAFKLIRVNDWTRAHRLAARADDPLPGKAIQWLDLTRHGGTAPFGEVAAFIRANPHWPRQALLHRRAEEAMRRTTPDAVVLAWFADRPPRTATGMARLGEALRAQGDSEAGVDILRAASAIATSAVSTPATSAFCAKPTMSPASTACCGTGAAAPPCA
ncbi:MAG: hypothetical protein ACTSRY_02205 [Alphaproteobacteria bacterium]